MTDIIVASNVHKTYDTGKIKVHALRGVDLTIKKGEMVAIMGPSGCGKTTLLNCFSGIDDLSEGQVVVEGKVLNEMSDNERSEYRAMRMGFIFQAYNLIPILSALENVELPLLVAGVNPKKAKEKALSTLKLVGLEDWQGHKPAEMSAGQQQRVAIARSLVNTPAIVWADEPTGNLDTENSSSMMDLLCSLNKANEQTFVIVTHDPNVANRTGKVLRMENGQIASQYTPKESELA
jgi:putative ABC transport system ATP-binding protein